MKLDTKQLPGCIAAELQLNLSSLVKCIKLNEEYSFLEGNMAAPTNLGSSTSLVWIEGIMNEFQ